MATRVATEKRPERTRVRLTKAHEGEGGGSILHGHLRDYRTLRKLSEADRQLMERLQRIAEEAEEKLRAEFMAAIRSIVDEADAAEIARIVERVGGGDLPPASAAAQIVRRVPWEKIRERMADAAQAVEELAQEGARVAADGLPPGITTPFPLTFVHVDRRAASWAKSNVGRMISGVTNESRRAIRVVIAQAIEQGGHPTVTARQLISEGVMDSLGLTSRQATALQNYKRGLQAADQMHAAGIPGSDARLAIADQFDDDFARRLARANRTEWPKLFRERWSRANRLGIGRSGQLGADKIADLVGGYRDRLIRLRAETITRTETINASSRGQELLWESMAEDGTIEASRWEREWVALWPDPQGRTCKLCRELDGRRAPIKGLFTAPQTPSGVQGPTRHPNCRCSQRLVPKKDAA